ncbi:hypothetical protein Nepgr_015516 [Nepenthes gracilis]|uniref:Uncharacterized protein n=1 Tax=Nepenthes gracilis TaxID=150966 RepID=A0AAD3SMZ9_NEPGR|nr:hypothetical protein Nepgr_015516 [Nepenthes gracilis]
MERASLCCCSGRETIRLGQPYNDDLAARKLTGGSSSSKPRWKVMWGRLVKEGKRKIFDSHSQGADQLSYYYDPYSYSQNFDQGLMWDEPDCLSRSFSMRFADPSTAFLKKVVV